MRLSYRLGPVLLVIDIREQVGHPGVLLVHIDVTDGQLAIHDELLAQHVAVEILALVAVVIADEVDDVAVHHSLHRLGHGLRLAVFVDPADADDAAVGVCIGEFHHQLGPVAVVQHGNAAQDGVAGAVVEGGFVVVGHGLVIDGDPGQLRGSQQVAVIVKFEDIVHAHVDVASAVVVEEVCMEGPTTSVPFSQWVLVEGESDCALRPPVMSSAANATERMCFTFIKTIFKLMDFDVSRLCYSRGVLDLFANVVEKNDLANTICFFCLYRIQKVYKYL